MALKGNKGEWSEIYALLKVVADRNLYSGNGVLKKNGELVFPVIKILRGDDDTLQTFTYEGDTVVISSDEETIKYPVACFGKYAAILLERMYGTKRGAFSIPEIEQFLHGFHCRSLKAKSSIKSDIRIVTHDLRTGATPMLGFSIKSQLGGASTLLNAGRTTNFVYAIRNVSLSLSQIEQINQKDTKSKIKDRIEQISALGGRLEFIGTESACFGNNLMLIDSALPKIVAEMLLHFFTSNLSRCDDLTEYLSRSNPLKFNTTGDHPFYSYKVKRLLTDVALGMMPSKPWTGKLDATGGYLIIKNDGDILCYHIYNRNEFEEYLLKNTKLETASSTRHDFGYVYQEHDGKAFFKLNLQIRFTK